ncbi:MAG TPA: hypothetical protein VG145_01225 [Xanthobacteraceae bacterium]|jgi:hypothetical protein|nr:hypothetical protein [Xanthobacteraceae bacterium]
MRLVVLVVGGAAVGALSVGGVRTIPQNFPMFQSVQSQMSQAVHALGGDMSKLELGKLGDINIDPLKAYEDVKRQITAGNFGSPIDFGSMKPVKLGDFPKLGDLSVGNKLHLDDAAMKRAMVSGWNSQIQQNNNRMQDIAAYSRNPMGWHGAPPF